MAFLTAEDVLNKAFSKTKYREGFDQDEVDDFLDEVANSISALTAERDELQSRLSEYQAGGSPAAPAAQAPESTGSSSANLLAAATDPNPPSATTMLSMAQRLHDDYVQAGEAERERIIDEGKAKAESIVEQAEKDAQVRLQSLDVDRADLERRIDDLRRFERDYRGHLRNYLENLLGDLEHNSARGPADAFSANAVPVPSQTEPEPVAEPVTDLGVDAPDVESPFAAPVEPVPSFPEAAAPDHSAQMPAPEPFAAAPFVAYGTEAASVDPVVPTFPEPVSLPPFPGSSEDESDAPSPFATASPFAPAPSTSEAEADPDEQGEPKPDEEAPRWNF